MMNMFKKIVLLVLGVFCILGCSEKITPEYSLNFGLNKKATLVNFYACSLKTENLAFVTNVWKKNKACIYSGTEKFYTKEKFTDTFVMVDVFKYTEIETNTVKTIPLLIRKDENFAENKEKWLLLKNEKPYYQHLY